MQGAVVLVRQGEETFWFRLRRGVRGGGELLAAHGLPGYIFGRGRSRAYVGRRLDGCLSSADGFLAGDELPGVVVRGGRGDNVVRFWFYGRFGGADGFLAADEFRRVVGRFRLNDFCDGAVGLFGSCELRRGIIKYLRGG